MSRPDYPDLDEQTAAIAHELRLIVDAPWEPKTFEDIGRPAWRSEIRFRFQADTGIFIRGDGARLNISGCFPHGFWKGGEHLITVSRTRTPEAIAKEIARRLLPEYLPAVRKAIEQRDEQESQRKAAEKLARELAEIMGSKDPTAREGHHDGQPWLIYTPAYDSVNVQPYGSVRFEVNTSDPEMAKRIAKVLATLMEKADGK